MVGWHHWLDGHEFEQAPGVGDGQGSLACCSPWGCKESDTTEQLNWLTDHHCPHGMICSLKEPHSAKSKETKELWDLTSIVVCRLKSTGWKGRISVFLSVAWRAQKPSKLFQLINPEDSVVLGMLFHHISVILLGGRFASAAFPTCLDPDRTNQSQTQQRDAVPLAAQVADHGWAWAQSHRGNCCGLWHCFCKVLSCFLVTRVQC